MKLKIELCVVIVLCAALTLQSCSTKKHLSKNEQSEIERKTSLETEYSAQDHSKLDVRKSIKKDSISAKTDSTGTKKTFVLEEFDTSNGVSVLKRRTTSIEEQSSKKKEANAISSKSESENKSQINRSSNSKSKLSDNLKKAFSKKEKSESENWRFPLIWIIGIVIISLIFCDYKTLFKNFCKWIKTLLSSLRRV